MPRTARVDFPGALQHVTIRGIERRSIFRDDEDRRRFVGRLERVVGESGTLCLAWALMTNHVHLLLQTEGVPLPEAMARLGTGYAGGFNRRHGRAGHLFQNRYHSRLVESDAHGLLVLRYIHLNPLKARIVADIDALERYPWTGHRALAGRGRCRFLAVDSVLAMFHDDPAAARRRLRAWMEWGIDGGMEAEWRGGTVRSQASGPVGGEAPSEGRGDRWLLANRLRLSGWDMARVMGLVCRALDVREEDVRSGLRRRSVTEARAAIAWLAHARLGVPQAAVARELGVVGPSVSRCLDRGRRVVELAGLDPVRRRGMVVDAIAIPSLEPSARPSATR